MHILASDFGWLTWIFIGVPFALTAVAVLSFIPATRGHWSAGLLAGPPVILGLVYGSLLLLGSMRSGMMPMGMCGLLLAPPVLGLLSLGVWAESRRPRE